MPRVKPNPTGFDLAAALAGAGIDRQQAIAPQLYAILRKRIVDGRLPPGAPVHEADMAALLLVSRTPLRAALQQLAAEGLVLTRPQVGSTIAPRNRERFLEALFVRAAIERQVARRLAEAGFDEGVLAANMQRQAASARVDDYAAFFEADEEFHALLATAADVPLAWQLVQTVKSHVDRERFILMSSIRGRSAIAYEEHLRLLDAIRRGDGLRAEQEMSDHVASVLHLSAAPRSQAGN